MAEALLIAGTVAAAGGTLASGAAEKANYDFQAQQLRQQATSERAVASREAFESKREGDLALSRARAVGAASGGGLDFTRMGDLEAESEFNALMALYEGEERARGRTMQARAAKAGGRNAMGAASIDAATTLVGGGSSFLEKYG